MNNPQIFASGNLHVCQVCPDRTLLFKQPIIMDPRDIGRFVSFLQQNYSSEIKDQQKVLSLLDQPGASN